MLYDPNLKTKTQDLDYLLVKNYLSTEIINIVKNASTYGFSCLTKKTVRKYFEQFNSYFYDTTKNLPEVKKELFYLHYFCNGLWKFNEYEKVDNFLSYKRKILYPNIIYVLVYFLPNVQKFIHDTIRKVFNEYKQNNPSIINTFLNNYYIDENIIKTDVLYLFFGNALRKFNPLDVENINYFYKSVFRKIFYYYFSSNKVGSTLYSSFDDMDITLSKSKDIPFRLMFYRDVLYSLYIEDVCKKSITLQQLNYNYNIFRNFIIDNVFQKMYYSAKKESSNITNSHYKILDIYEKTSNKENYISDEFLKKIKKLPTIYKLLRSVHITNSILNKENYNFKTVKFVILEELLSFYKNHFSESFMNVILEKVADNFAESVLKGDYINPITFAVVDYHNYSFITQLREFIRICLEEVSI